MLHRMQTLSAMRILSGRLSDKRVHCDKTEVHDDDDDDDDDDDAQICKARPK